MTSPVAQMETRVVRSILLSLLIALGGTFTPACVALAHPQQTLEDPMALELVDRICHQPELMNLDYLDHLIGRPENEFNHRYGQTRNYFWYRRNHTPMYELTQTQTAPGRVAQSQFIIHIPPGALTFAEVDAMCDFTQDNPDRRFIAYGNDASVQAVATQSRANRRDRHGYYLADTTGGYDGRYGDRSDLIHIETYNQEPERLFDQNACVTQLYNTAPNTSLCFTADHDSDYVTLVRVIYQGPVLPQPTIADVYEAEDRAMEVPISYIEGGYAQMAIPMLTARLKAHPQDAIARLWLARALADERDINNAIDQYKLVLSTALPGSQLQDVCLSALLELRAVPVEIAGNVDEPRRNFRILDNGRRLQVIEPRDKDNQDQDEQEQEEQNQENAGFAAIPQQSLAGTRIQMY
jgi:hypothetical protein